MFARIQTVHQPAEKLNEMTKFAREQLPSSHKLQGFRGFYFLIDRENGKALMISFWETWEDVQQLEASNASLRERTAAATGVESPPSELFEVALQAP